MNIHRLLLTNLIVMSLSLNSYAEEVTVIVNKNKVETLTKRELVAIYLGKSNTFKDGVYAIPLHQKESSDAYRIFTRDILRKTTKQHKAYWAKKVFTGKGRPPESVGNDSEMLRRVAADSRYIGYIKDPNIDDGIRFIFYKK